MMISMQERVRSSVGPWRCSWWAVRLLVALPSGRRTGTGGAAGANAASGGAIAWRARRAAQGGAGGQGRPSAANDAGPSRPPVSSRGDPGVRLDQLGGGRRDRLQRRERQPHHRARAQAPSAAHPRCSCRVRRPCRVPRGPRRGRETSRRSPSASAQVGVLRDDHHGHRRRQDQRRSAVSRATRRRRIPAWRRTAHALAKRRARKRHSTAAALGRRDGG